MKRQRLGMVALVAVASLGSGIIGALVMQTTGANAQQSSYVAREFRVVDARGRTRALLTATTEAPMLILTDASGTIRAVVALDGNGNPSVSLADGSQTPRFGVTVSPNGTPVLGLYNSRGTIAAGMQVLDDNGYANLFDSTGTLIWTAP